MKSVIYTDRRGWKRRSFVKDGDPASKFQYGLPAGPPDLDQIDWDEFKKVLNDYLVENGLFDFIELERAPFGLTGATSIFKRYLVGLYRQEAKLKQPSV